MEKLDGTNSEWTCAGEYSWGDEMFRAGLAQLYSQLVRGRDGESVIRDKYCSLIHRASQVEDQRMTNLLLSLMLQTRDIHEGKGEYRLFYVLLGCWCRAEWTDNIASKFLCVFERYFGQGGTTGIGSWKDVKYIFQYCRELLRWAPDELATAWKRSPILVMLVSIVRKQLDADCVAEKPSLLAKWLPREKSAFAWQVPIFAHALANCQVPWSALSKMGKAHYLAEYRRTISELSRGTNAVQRLQCSDEWAGIDFTKDVTSLTMSRQHKAFMMEGTASVDQMATNKLQDRQECKANYLAYLEDCKTGKHELAADRVTIGELVKRAWGIPDGESEGGLALQLGYDTKVAEVEISGALRNICPVCDTSGSMTWDSCPLFDAIGLAMLIAETSVLGPRIMIFASEPRWIQLRPTDSFVEKVATIRAFAHYAGAGTDLCKAYALMFTCCQKAKMTSADVEKLHLVILSDMPINEADPQFTGSLRENCGLMLRTADYSTPPSMVYWNMRGTERSPVVVTNRDDGILLVSGCTAAALTGLCTDGVRDLEQTTAVRSTLRILSRERYTFFWDV